MSYWDDSPIPSLGSSEYLCTDIGWSAKHRGFTMVNQEKMGDSTTISDDIRKRFGEMTGHINDNTGTTDCITNKNGSIWGTPPPLLFTHPRVQPSCNGGNAHHAGTGQNLGAYRRPHGASMNRPRCRAASPSVSNALRCGGLGLGMACQNAKDFPVGSEA